MSNQQKLLRVFKISAKIVLTFNVFQLGLNTYLKPVEATRQEPVNIGFIFSLPWDVSNTLRAPLAGPLSIVLAAGLALILVFGLLAAPIWYWFGIPNRRYHFHEFKKPDIFSILAGDDGRRSLEDFDLINENAYAFLHGNYSTFEDMDHPSLKNFIKKDHKEYKTPTDTNTADSSVYPDFTKSLFFFVPDLQEECRKLMVCHAHGFLNFLPDPVVQVYSFFSKKLLNVPECYQAAIVHGLMDQSNCMKTYTHCTQDIVTIAKSTLFYNIPEHIRELWQLENIPM